jgi:RNA polymerase sigma-70 factor (ECF subfamily)
MSETEPSDRELILRYQQDRDEASLRLLFGRHFGAVHGFLLRFLGSTHDADDLTQETLIKAWRQLKQFRLDGNFRSWLFGIARHAALDWLRKRRDRSFSSFEDDYGNNPLADNLEDDADLPEVALDAAVAATELQSALNKLPPPFREVVVLRHQNELTFEELGEILKEPLNTVKSRYRRAVLALRKLMTPP